MAVVTNLPHAEIYFLRCLVLRLLGGDHLDPAGSRFHEDDLSLGKTSLYNPECEASSPRGRVCGRFRVSGPSDLARVSPGALLSPHTDTRISPASGAANPTTRAQAARRSPVGRPG